MPSHSPRPVDRLDLGFAPVAPFFLSSLAWNFSLGMTYMLIPLYARALGMPGTQIGTLIALPVVLQMVFTLLGGALADRLGGKNLATASCVLTCIAGVVFTASAGFGLMLTAQFLMAVARAMFWPATWSLASQLPGNAGKHMGRLNAATNAGQIAGTAAAGFIIAIAGYRFGFGIMTAVAAAALLLNQMFRGAGAAPRVPAKPILTTYRMLIGKRTIRYGILCAFISALPLSLSFSFYPIMLVEQGLDSDTAGALISLRSVGAVVAGFFTGSFIKDIRGVGMPLTSAIIVGLSIIFAAAVSQPAPIGIFMFALGVGSAIMTLYFQMLISLVSTTETRGSAMALGGVGWGVSHLTAPFAMGILQDYIGIHVAFYLVGGFALMCGLALIPLQRWAFRAE
jgi:MFS family permease